MLEAPDYPEITRYATRTKAFKHPYNDKGLEKGRSAEGQLLWA